MLYILQVIVYTGLMLCIYLLLLRNKPMHKFNRAYLLASSVVPLILPLLKLPEAYRPQQNTETLFTGVLQEVIVGVPEPDSNFVMPTWLVVAAALYLAVIVAFAVLKLWAYAKMRSVINKSVREDKNGYILLKQTGHGPGSWGRYIFLPEGDVDSTIIRHEQVHIALHHSRDIIFMNIVQAVMWPNIFLHLLKKELIQVHEFQADAAVNIEAEDYSALLLSSVFNTDKLQLAHSFINHPIKRRIMMLHKKSTSGKARGIIASVLAAGLLAGIVTLQSCEQKQEQTAAEPQSTENTKAYTYAYKMPEYKEGGTKGVYEFLAKTIKFPKEAEVEGIQGRVPVRFIVDENGKVGNVELAESNHNPLLAEAALAAVSQMPDWIPGEDSLGNKVSVYYTIPITFKLDAEDGQSSTEKGNNPQPPPPPVK